MVFELLCHLEFIEVRIQGAIFFDGGGHHKLNLLELFKKVKGIIMVKNTDRHIEFWYALSLLINLCLYKFRINLLLKANKIG